MNMSSLQITNQVIWITGLSGSGKTTLANRLFDELKLSNKNLVLLDGDELRYILNLDNSNESKYYSRSQRISLALSYSKLCKYLSNQGMIVVIATISLFREVHEWNRKNLPNYFEIYMNPPSEILVKRDSKGLYKAFSEGKIKNITGIDIEFDAPVLCDFEFNSFESYRFEIEYNNCLNKIRERVIQ